ncbi:MAG: helix-turn-helix transcriptional regulator [Sphaerochaetaceae bacterium]|nr:helix-turn-helix transcriptional regulator [Sphaerochaetaceae bacterium]
MTMNTSDQELEVARKLKEIRENQQLSQLELSLKSDVSQNMITYIETGKRTPTLTTLLKLCNALNINPSILFSPSSDEVITKKRQIISLIEKYMN